MASTFTVKNGDIVMSNHSGRPIMVTGQDKLIQDIIEFFTVNITQYGFGAGINELVGSVYSIPSMLIGLASRNIKKGIEKYMVLQSTGPFTPLTLEERVIGVNNIVVKQDTNDPTTFYFTANIVTASGKSVQLPRIYLGA